LRARPEKAPSPAASETEGRSRMTFVVDASTDAEELVSEIKLVEDVVNIRDISDHELVSREMALIRVNG
jgi:acetolactate synthase small subunit